MAFGSVISLTAPKSRPHFPVHVWAQWVLSVLLIAGCAQLEAAEPQARIEQNREHWLQLEADRRAYERMNPIAGAETARQRDLRLWMQGQRDRDRLLRQQQSPAARPQIHRTEPQPARHPQWLYDPAAERALRSQQLHNRMQRRSWPY